MATAVGLHSKVAIQVQTARGTADTLGAGDQIIIKPGATFPTGDKVEMIGDQLDGYAAPSGARKVRGDKEGALPVVPYLLGVPELLGQVLGTATAGTEVNNAKTYKRNYEYDSSAAEALSTLYTLAWHADPDNASTQLKECKDLQIIGWSISAPADGEIEAEIKIYSETDPIWDSAVNTGSSTWTVPWNEFSGRPKSTILPGLLHSDHFENRIWLAPQGQGTFAAADKLCLVDWTLEVDFAAKTDNYAACGGKAARPGKWSLTISGTLSEWSSDTLVEARDARTPYKLKLHGVSERGAEGNSVSAATPSTDISGGTDTSFQVNLDGDGAQTVTLTVGTLNTGALIAAAIQTAVRALTAADAKNQQAYDYFACDYDSSVSGRYFLQSGSNKGAASSVVITDAASDNVADDLKIGSTNGGTESVGVYDAIKFFFPTVYITEFEPVPDTAEVLQPTLTLTVAQGPDSAPVGFTVSDDSDLSSDIDAEAMRIVTINRQATKPA